MSEERIGDLMNICWASCFNASVFHYCALMLADAMAHLLSVSSSREAFSASISFHARVTRIQAQYPEDNIDRLQDIADHILS